MVDSYKPYMSGITTAIDLNKKFLERAGHEVYVFTFGELDKQFNEPRVIYSKGVPLADSGFYLSLRYSPEAKQLLQTMDIVHVHHPFLSGRLALRYCRPAHIPIVFTNHTRYDLYAQAYLPIMPEELSHGLLQTYMQSFCEAVDLVVAPSPGMEQILRSFNVTNNVTVVPNGVDLASFQAAKPFSRRSLGFKEDDLLLVYAGRIAPEKNLRFLIRAFSGVAEAIPNTHLLILGGGIQQFEEEIWAFAAELQNAGRIHFLGRVQYEQLPVYLASCDLFVTASVSEVHPLSVIEAMGAGLPTMGIKSVGVGDTVRDEVTGLLSSEDIPAYTAKLTRLCLDKDLRTRMSKAARLESYTYTIERSTEMMLRHYEEIRSNYKPDKEDWTQQFRNLLREINQYRKQSDQEPE